MNKFLRIFLAVSYLLGSNMLSQPAASAAAAGHQSFTVDLDIQLADVANIRISEGGSTWPPKSIRLSANGLRLSNNSVSLPLSTLAPLLESLVNLYPASGHLICTTCLTSFDRDFSLTLGLKDNRRIKIQPVIRYREAAIWEVAVYPNERATDPLAIYVLIRPDIPDMLSSLWKPLMGHPYPGENSTPINLDKEDPSLPERLEFATDPVLFPTLGDPDSLIKKTLLADPFIPLLNRNDALQKLFAGGYTLFFADLNLMIDRDTFEPIQYEGTIALATPEKNDVIIGKAVIPLSEDEPAITSLTSEIVSQRIAQRRATPFLAAISDRLPGLIFLSDTQSIAQAPKHFCAMNKEMAETAVYHPALMDEGDHYVPVSFFELPGENAWSFSIQTGWDFTKWEPLLEDWLSTALPGVSFSDLESINTTWMYTILAFKPGFGFANPEAFKKLQEIASSEEVARLRKEKGVVTFDFVGPLLVRDTGKQGEFYFCGNSLYPPNLPYPIENVTEPAISAFRINLLKSQFDANGWLEPLRMFGGEYAHIVSSKTGYLHMVGIEEGNVKYAEGWANGVQWTQSQILGEADGKPLIFTTPPGEIHIVWTITKPYGSMHIWRSADGKWNKPEFWYGLGGLLEIQADSQGTLHIISGKPAAKANYWYTTWTASQGLALFQSLTPQASVIDREAKLSISARGEICAVWGQAPASQSGTGGAPAPHKVFSTCRKKDGQWEAPTFLGTLASFSDAAQQAPLVFEVDAQGNKLVAWQSPRGLVSRVRTQNGWQPEVILASTITRTSYTRSGTMEKVALAAGITFAVTPEGQILAAWTPGDRRLHLSAWEGAGWVERYTAGPYDADLEPKVLKMVVDDAGTIHLLFSIDNLVQYTALTGNNVFMRRIGATGSDLTVDFLTDPSGIVTALIHSPKPQITSFIPSTATKLFP